MYVTNSNLVDALRNLQEYTKKSNLLSLDTETTGVWFWRSKHVPWYVPRVFSIQISTQDQDFYFDLNEIDENRLPALQSLFDNEKLIWFIHNAKFDLHQMRNHGLEIKGTVHCTKAIARVMNNLEEGLSLDDLSAKYLGANKIDVKSYMVEHGLFTKVKKFGHNDKVEDWLHFDKLPLEMLVEYGKRDTRLCFQLGCKQLLEIEKQSNEKTAGRERNLLSVLQNEHKLTKVIFEMESEGVKLDLAYTEEAYEHEVAEYRRIESELNRTATAQIGSSLDWNSAKQLKPLFDKLGEPYSYTEKGNASFDRDALEESESQLAKDILRYRYHYKRAHTYFENFIWLADDKGVLHADAQQSGTQFARMSYWTPNLQNIPKRRDKDEAQYKVRACFVPKPGFILADFDYSGAEYYMTLDYAREMPVIEQIKQGMDPHSELGRAMQLKDRDAAKTMQFRILYGAGQEAVGKSLGYKGFEAKKIGKQKKDEYFARLPAVGGLLRQISDVAKSRGYIVNWLGRILQYDRNTAYKSPNGLIQSGVGDMTKKAMVKLAIGPLKGRKSAMLIQVHDAILMQLHPEDFELIPLIKETMSKVYPHKAIQMEVDAGYSEKNWAALQDELHGVS